MLRTYRTLSLACKDSEDALLRFGVEVDTGHWQGYETQGKPDLVTRELLNMAFTAPIPYSPEELVDEVRPNLPWAEEEFQERVGRVPRNPHASLEKWPWWRGQVEATMHEGMFTHTYSERFWPKLAGPLERIPGQEIHGIRYPYGDLDSVVEILLRRPYTRQAYFPIFFPEDTGAKHGGRVPCTLGYHFLLRNHRLNLTYPIRSCDMVRHFRDDVYMAARLCQWVLDQLQGREQIALERSPEEPDWLWADVFPGKLTFWAFSFHAHKGDLVGQG